MLTPHRIQRPALECALPATASMPTGHRIEPPESADVLDLGTMLTRHRIERQQSAAGS